MKVLIVAKTRRGAGACVGGIDENGRSVRLIAANAGANERAGLEYAVGDVWEIEASSDPSVTPPHLENVIVYGAQRLRRSEKLQETIYRFMAPVVGGPEVLFGGLVQATAAGGLYVAQSTGLPRRSTMFWAPDQALVLDSEGKRIRYRYPTGDGGRTLTFVGFQEPLPTLPAGTLLRVSLAHPWRPKERPDEELRCFVQLSGWFLDSERRDSSPADCEGRLVADPPPPAESESLPVPWRALALDLLKQTFGFPGFLPVQEEVIARILKGQDSLVIMPTGGGKSLCYQLPALLLEGLTVVVSPLVALMQDQVRQLHQLDVPAACLNHMVPLRDWTQITSAARHGSLKVLYVAPETLLRPEMLLLLQESRLACFAIDEAHCISEWGHDFRPEYRQLREVRQRFPQAVCVALTATATTRVRADIRRLLGIPREFVASFNRANLFLAVEPRRDALAQILAFLEARRGQSGIIYCGTRKQADQVCASLNANGWTALPYHAGLADDVRRQNQERFICDDAPLMVATVAFGMGINKSNVRFVIHAHLPKDLESYYQEIGRAGRDGLPAQCLLLYSRADAVVHRHFIQEGAPSERVGRQARLEALLRFAEVRECRRGPLLAYFGETFGGRCRQCDNCTRAPVSGEHLEVTAAAQTFLRCAQESGQLFGAAHIISILRGSKGERIQARHHDQLSGYGCGKQYSVEQWRELGRQFVLLGLLDADLEFGSLRLTPKGEAVLAGGETVRVPLEHLPVMRPSAEVSESHDADLFAKLRQVRKELADQSHLPAYIIFSDRALLEMAARLPQDDAAFLGINGVGQAKLAKYGQPFLQLIRAHARGSGRATPTNAANSEATPIVRSAVERRFHEMGRLFAAGKTAEEISQQFDINRATVVHNLQRYVEEGGRLDAGRVLAESRLAEPERARVLSQFAQIGVERLKPVHEALAGSVSYEELWWLRLYLWSQRGR